MRSLVIMCACVTLAALTGCYGRTSSAPRSEPEGNPWASLSSQLAAAEGTVDVKMRDELLARLAQDAANGGDSHFVNEALKRITSSAIKERAAAAVEKLARQVKRDQAIEVARSPVSRDLR
jgi:hypothetical protein